MTHRSWGLVLAALGAACGSTPPAAVGPGVRVVGGSLDATALLTPTAARATRGGAGALSLVTSGLLREGERAGAFIESTAAPADKPARCLFLFARGARSLTDVDLAVYSDEGEPLAQDEEPDAAPGIVLCPPYPTRMHVSARAAAGDGLVAVGVQTVPQPAAEAVRRAVSARGSLPATTRQPEQWPELEAAVAAELVRLGPGAREIRRVGLPGDRLVTTSFTEEIAADSCASLVLVPEPGLLGLDVELQDDEGGLLLRSSRASEALASLHFCTDVPRKVTASFRPHLGRGLVGGVWFRAPREPSQGARVLSTRAASPATWLRDETKRLDAAREARGQKRERTSTFRVKPAALFHQTLQGLDPDACHSITAVVGAANARLTLSLLTTDGRPIVSRQGGARASAVVCGAESVQLAIAIREAEGQGQLLVHRIARPSSVRTAATAASRAVTVLDELGATIEQSLPLTETMKSTTIDVARGRCVLAVASGELGGSASLEARALGASEAVLLSRGDDDARWLRVCADDTARRVELRASAPAGLLGWALVPSR